MKNTPLFLFLEWMLMSFLAGIIVLKCQSKHGLYVASQGTATGKVVLLERVQRRDIDVWKAAA